MTWHDAIARSNISRPLWCDRYHWGRHLVVTHQVDQLTLVLHLIGLLPLHCI